MGQVQLRVPPSAGLRVAPRRSGEVLCPYCRTCVADEERSCPGCEAAYHDACWEELGGCATLGCAARSAPAEQAPAEPAPAEPACSICRRRERQEAMVHCPRCAASGRGVVIFHLGCRMDVRCPSCQPGAPLAPALPFAPPRRHGFSPEFAELVRIARVVLLVVTILLALVLAL